MKDRLALLSPLSLARMVALVVALAFVFAAAVGASAQSVEESLEAAVAADVAQADDEAEAEAAEAEVDAGPQMRRLFFSTEERQELEILRRDSAADALLESNRVVPVTLHEEPFVGGEVIALVRDEDEPLVFNAAVRRHSDGRTFVWIGEESFDLQKDRGFLDRTRHLILDPESVSPEGIVGVDRISRRRFRLQVGQNLDFEGKVRDIYPIIVVRNKRR